MGDIARSTTEMQSGKMQHSVLHDNCQQIIKFLNIHGHNARESIPREKSANEHPARTANNSPKAVEKNAYGEPNAEIYRPLR